MIPTACSSSAWGLDVQVAEIKRLHAAAALVRSELSKLEEQLDECKAHRDFLMRITPPDFFTNVRRCHQRAFRSSSAGFMASHGLLCTGGGCQDSCGQCTADSVAGGV